MSQQTKGFFPVAITYPDFFNNNLADDNRVLKVLTGELCWARAFYYQLLKIILEIQCGQQKIVDYGQVLLSMGEQMLPKANTQKQAQRIALAIAMIQKFLKFMENNPELSFESEINKNEEIDESIIMILQEIVKDGAYQNESGQNKLKYLGQIFQLRMFQFDGGIKFEDSDTFIYIENDRCMYVAFLQIGTEFQQYEQDQNKDISIERMQPHIDPNHLVQQNPARDPNSRSSTDQVEGEQVITSMAPDNHRQTFNPQHNSFNQQSPVEYLFSHKYRTPAIEPEKVVEKITNKPELLRLEQSKDDRNMQFTLGVKYQTVESSQNLQKVQSSTKTTQVNQGQSIYSKERKFENKQSVVENVSVPAYKNEANYDMFYKPTGMDKMSSVNSMKLKGNKKDPLDICNDSEKGTFYRKFTDTRILNMLSEPYRSKVKMLKNRFIGVGRTPRNGLQYKKF